VGGGPKKIKPPGRTSGLVLLRDNLKAQLVLRQTKKAREGEGGKRIRGREPCKKKKKNTP